MVTSIDTRLRSFYFKLFHKSIALNDFVFRIKRKDSPNCIFCDKEIETIVHLFCDCECVVHLWNDLLQIIHLKEDPDFALNNFVKMFGVSSNKFLTYLFVSLKYFVYVCKYQNTKPNFNSFKTYIGKSNICLCTHALIIILHVHVIYKMLFMLYLRLPIIVFFFTCKLLLLSLLLLSCFCFIWKYWLM